jgi:MoaA/NifB/PqqE/SkfB family radical SAM enzyme
MLSDLLKYAYHAALDGPSGDRWHPFLAVYYLTYACDFRCPYCCDGAGRPYYQLPNATLDARGVLELLGAIRRHCDYVVITGGEPLQHPEVDAVLDGLGALRFKRAIFTTNGWDLEPHLPALGRSAVTDVVFSLDTFDHGKADACYGAGPGALARILANIERAARRPRAYEITISSVATPESLDDLPEVCRFAWERGFTIAVAPQLVGVKAHASLAGDERYRRLFDHLIAEKRRGRPVFGTVRYLEHMRDLRGFRCRPFTMLVVSPTGDVYYPCLEIGQTAGNLLCADLHQIRREGERRFGPQPACDVRCHSACALSFALALGDPASVLDEVYLQARLRLKAALGGATAP